MTPEALSSTKKQDAERIGVLSDFLSGHGKVVPVCKFGILAAVRGNIYYHMLRGKDRMEEIANQTNIFLERGPSSSPLDGTACILVEPMDGVEHDDLVERKKRMIDLYADIHTVLTHKKSLTTSIDIFRRMIGNILKANDAGARELPEVNNQRLFAFAMGPENKMIRPRYAPESIAVLTWAHDAEIAESHYPQVDALIRKHAKERREGAPPNVTKYYIDPS